MSGRIIPGQAPTIGTIFSSLDALDAAIISLRSPEHPITSLSSRHG